MTRELAEAQGVVDGKISSLVTEMAEIKANDAVIEAYLGSRAARRAEARAR